jgi:hypothetical protein
MTTTNPRRDQQRDYRARNRERILARQKAWHLRNREHRRIYHRAYSLVPAHLAARFCTNAKQSAKRHGVAFDLTPADTVVPARCPVLGIVLRVGVGKFTANSPTLQRLDPSRGFVRGNVRIVSKRARWQRAVQQRTAAADGLRSPSQQQY